MNLRDRLLASRTFAISLAAVLIAVVAIVIAITVVVARNAYLTLRLSDVCPDYFSYEYAYVVDEERKGMDSVAVMLRDNSNVNMIYRTFTDSTGRFVLFHDFGSFALHTIPFSYYLFVSTGDGWRDTIRYTFERYRVCHFRKTEGPDTIVCRRTFRSQLQLQLEQTQQVIIDSGDFRFAPWDEMALSSRVPREVKAKLPPDTVLYTTINVAGSSIPFAVIPVQGNHIVLNPRQSLSEGVWYLLDRDGDRDLNDETPVMFAPEGYRTSGEIIDCTVRTCRTIDSVDIGNRWYWFELQLRDMQRREPLLRVRRADAVSGTLVFTSDRLLSPPPRAINPEELFDAFEEPVPVDTMRYRLLLWDRALRGFTDLRTVVVAIDRNGDGTFDNREGSVELCEQASGKIVFDRFSFVIDTISADGRLLFCSDIRAGSIRPTDATRGAWSADFTAAASCPLSLYQECAANKYVILYFFDGNVERNMETPEVKTFVSLMNDHLGLTRIIGINRRNTGDSYSREPVINENLGWKGPLVRQFHNHREREIVCLDNTATIIYRGEVGVDAISALWKHAGAEDVIAVSAYEQQYADREVVVK